jgi:hypothetical protein
MAYESQEVRRKGAVGVVWGGYLTAGGGKTWILDRVRH